MRYQADWKGSLNNTFLLLSAIDKVLHWPSTRMEVETIPIEVSLRVPNTHELIEFRGAG